MPHPELIKNITNLYGDQGTAWLKNLPTLLAQYEKKWNLKIEPCFA